MKRLAIYNFGMFKVAGSDPANQGFHDRGDPNLAAAEQSDGFIARSGYEDDPGPESWGQQIYPRFYVERGDGWSPSTLSLWRDIASLMAFSYSGVHAEAMRHAREWFVKPAWPGYVLWWVDAGHTPEWAEGVERMEFLHDNGGSPFAFDFKTPFDALGNPVLIDRELVKRTMRLNAERRSA
jgi:hypothetical protein